MLALMPACFVMSNFCVSAQALDNAATTPELNAEHSKPIAIERSVKVPWLKTAKLDLKKMSESSAVRMACGGSLTVIYEAPSPVQSAKGKSASPTKFLKPVPVQRTAQIAQPTAARPAKLVQPTPVQVKSVQPVAPSFWGFFHL